MKSIAIKYIEGLEDGEIHLTGVILDAQTQEFSFDGRALLLTYTFIDGSKLIQNEHSDWSAE